MSKIVTIDVKMARGWADHKQTLQSISTLTQTLFPDATVHIKSSRSSDNPRYMRVRNAGPGAEVILKQAFEEKGLKTEYVGHRFRRLITPTISSR